MEILELKIKITKIKNSLNTLNIRRSQKIEIRNLRTDE